MIEPWVLITVFGAFFQNLRSALQKKAASQLTTLGASYTRFLFAFPFAIIYLFFLNRYLGYAIPTPSTEFFFYCVAGGIAQIVFTFLLISLFGRRNFAVGTVFSKTELVQVAILGYFILGEPLTINELLALLVTTFGVILLAVKDINDPFGGIFKSFSDSSTIWGLGSGAALGLSVVLYRAAALSLEYDGTFLMSAAFTLVIALTVQSICLGVIIHVRERETIPLMFFYWKESVSVGVAGIIASIAWFTAFTMHSAAQVRAVGQIELVFTFLASVLIFKEKSSALEVFGMILIVAGIVFMIAS